MQKSQFMNLNGVLVDTINDRFAMNQAMKKFLATKLQQRTDMILKPKVYEFMGMKVIEDPLLPDNIIELRNKSGKLLKRLRIGGKLP